MAAINLDPRIEEVRVKYDLAREDFWELPQKKGTWIAKHSALEVAAVKAGIRFDMPQVLEANGNDGTVAVCVRGELGDRFIWSIGECNPKNNRNAYPWAMAEKRALDRVILKLLGLHGLTYSEDEADDFRAASAPAYEHMSSYYGKKVLNFDNMLKEIDTAPTVKVLDNWREFYAKADAWMPSGWVARLQERMDERRKELDAAPGQTEGDEQMDEAYRQTMGSVSPQQSLDKLEGLPKETQDAVKNLGAG